jgi:hypothetical protein
MSNEWTPQSLIREECWNEFRKLYAVVWDQLVFLRTSLFLFTQVARFPINFLPNDDQWFLVVIARALLDSVVLGISRLTTDQAGDLLTLPRFRNLALTMLRDDAAGDFRTTLKTTSFDASTKDLATRARDLRDSRIAHLRLEEIRKGAALRMAVPELEHLVSETERLFTPLLFGGEAMFLPLAYDSQTRKTNQPRVADYEAILTALAAKSHVLRYPEEASDVWPEVRKSWSAEDVEALNLWRRRLGLPIA